MFSFQNLVDVAPICQAGMVIKPSWLEPSTRLMLPLLADYMDARPLGRRFFLNVVTRVALHIGMHGNGWNDEDEFIHDLLYIKQRHPVLAQRLHVATDIKQADELVGLDLPDALVVMTREAQTVKHPIVVKREGVGHSPTYLLFGGGTFHVASDQPISTSILLSHNGSLTGAHPTYSPATGWAGGIVDL